jgi:hypothetical protein
MEYGQAPFGLREIVLTNIAGTVQVTLPAARTLKFSERIAGDELLGDDAVQEAVALSRAVDWEMEAGGISLEAYALMTGRTATEAGSTPNQTNTLTGEAGDVFPYFKIYGKAIGASTDNTHCKLYKCKLLGTIEGSFQLDSFFMTSCKGIALTNGTKIFEFVQNETAATLPSS